MQSGQENPDQQGMPPTIRPTNLDDGPVPGQDLEGDIPNEEEEKEEGHPPESEDLYIIYRPLYIAVDNGNVEATRSFLSRHPEALTAPISPTRETALHIAVLAGQLKVVEELVRFMHPQALEIMTTDHSTALNYAALGGTTKIAECLVERNNMLLRIPNQFGEIPILAAARCGQRDLMQYLYKKTPTQVFDPVFGPLGAVFLSACIDDEFYGNIKEQK